MYAIVHDDNCVFFLMIRRPPRSTLDRSSAASDVYKRQMEDRYRKMSKIGVRNIDGFNQRVGEAAKKGETITLSLIHISEPTRPY